MIVFEQLRTYLNRYIKVWQHQLFFLWKYLGYFVKEIIYLNMWERTNMRLWVIAKLAPMPKLTYQYQGTP